MGPFDMRGLVPFLLCCGAVLGAVLCGLALAAWRVGWWLWEHIQWVP